MSSHNHQDNALQNSSHQDSNSMEEEDDSNSQSGENSNCNQISDNMNNQQNLSEESKRLGSSGKT